MRIVYFAHSLRSCWNNGNAHFQRGVLRELVLAGHEVTIVETKDAWSLANLLHDIGPEALHDFDRAYPELASRIFPSDLDPCEALADAELVIVHEWNEASLVARIGRRRAQGGRFTLLFHDTHHRAVSDPRAIEAFDLSAYDGVLAFGEALADIYRRWGMRAFVWREAADIRLFRPPQTAERRSGLVWIGNWGDDERSRELESFLLRPAARVGLRQTIYGVRYPPQAREMLARYGADYHGWLPNARAPAIFARSLMTVRVPRRYYSSLLPGIPTIRVFEALACGIPLICAPWEDDEHLFEPGRDYLIARSEDEMTCHLASLRDDARLREDLAAHGLATICARHSCAHRAEELLSIAACLGAPEEAAA